MILSAQDARGPEESDSDSELGARHSSGAVMIKKGRATGVARPQPQRSFGLPGRTVSL